MRAFAVWMTWLALAVSGCGSSVPQMESAESTSSATVDTGTADATATDGPETGAVPPGCGENLLEDPGFEGGTPNPAWVEESPLFGTPICDASCTDDVGANPFSGLWWVWFGGVAMPDTAMVRQSVLIPEGVAMLRFRFSVNAASGTGNDVFSVRLDEQTELLVTDAEVGVYGGWRIVELDVSAYADGGEHTLSFSASLAGVGVTNFFVDDVELLLCEDDAASSSTTSQPQGTGTGSSTSGGR